MAKKPKKDGLLRKITRRFSRKKLEEPKAEVSSDTTRPLDSLARGLFLGKTPFLGNSHEFLKENANLATTEMGI